MRFSKNNLVFLVIIVFIAVGLTVIWFSREAEMESADRLAEYEGEFSSAPFGLQNLMVKSDDYAQQVRPWLDRAGQDPSSDTVRDIKSKILGLRGADQDLGLAQVSLFLAFDAWEQFLSTQEASYRETAIRQFSRFGDLRPDLRPEAEGLKSVLK